MAMGLRRKCEPDWNVMIIKVEYDSGLASQ